MTQKLAITISLWAIAGYLTAAALLKWLTLAIKFKELYATTIQPTGRHSGEETDAIRNDSVRTPPSNAYGIVSGQAPR